MHWLDRSYDTLAENLALDEVLLDAVETGVCRELVRVWELCQVGVVLGRASRIEVEVDSARCRADQIPIGRRVSGGCAVLCGRGCLMYSVVLPKAMHRELSSPDRAHEWVLARMARALSSATWQVERQGTSDMTIRGRKFSGNSMRVQRGTILYHGTLLYDFDLTHLAQYLRMPPREPDYRQHRSHDEFVTNLPYSRTEILERLKREWNCADHESLDWSNEVQHKVASRYGCDAWNLQW